VACISKYKRRRQIGVGPPAQAALAATTHVCGPQLAALKSGGIAGIEEKMPARRGIGVKMSKIGNLDV